MLSAAHDYTRRTNSRPPDIGVKLLVSRLRISRAVYLRKPVVAFDLGGYRSCRSILCPTTGFLITVSWARDKPAAATSPPSKTRSGAMAGGQYTNILLERRGAVGIVTLNRPQALNALNPALVAEIGSAFDDLEADPAIGAIVLTGNEKAFAAGADIKEMAEKTYMQAYQEDFITRGWERVAQCRKPVVAAVGGFALGGGCEVAMMCDIVIAAENARFGQPEINLGTMPGAGGTQRLPRFIGKAKAMDLCLTGRMMDAA